MSASQSEPNDAPFTQLSDADEPKRTRRSVLAGSAAALFLVGGGAVLGRGAWAKDEDEDDDHSGPGGGGDDNDDDDHHGLPPDQTTQVSGTTTVRIVDERFEPNNILIETGQTVTWVNQDDDQHTASGGGMDTGVIDPGAEGTVTFLEPGEFRYTCNFHPEMLGLVTVTGASKATPDATPEESAGTAPTTADVDIVDFAFEPAVATIAVGGTITWTNIGQAPHTIFADWADSDIMDPGVTFSWTFDEAGTYDYKCGLHPAMEGSIEVVAAATGGDGGTPVAAESQGPQGSWFIEYEFEDPDLLPNQQALASFESDGALYVDLVTEADGRAATDGHGTWQRAEGGALESTWVALVRDSASGELLTVKISDSAQVGADGTYDGTLEAEVTTASGSSTSLTGTSSGRRLTP